MDVFFRPNNEKDAVVLLIVLIVMVVVFGLVRRIQCG